MKLKPRDVALQLLKPPDKVTEQHGGMLLQAYWGTTVLETSIIGDTANFRTGDNPENYQFWKIESYKKPPKTVTGCNDV